MRDTPDYGEATNAEMLSSTCAEEGQIGGEPAPILGALKAFALKFLGELGLEVLKPGTGTEK